MISKKQKIAAKKNLARARKKLRPSANKFMRKSGKTKGKAIATNVRKKTATVIEHISGPRGGETKYRFPMPDLAHARNALARLPQAKDLSQAEKDKIKKRALSMLGRAKGTKSEKRFAKGLIG